MKNKRKLANLRVCASCEWIYRLSDKQPESTHWGQGDCPKCGFGSYGARYVYGDRAYRYAVSQEPWINKKIADYSFKLWKIVKDDNPIKKKNPSSLRFLSSKESLL